MFELPPIERGQHDALDVVHHDPQNAGAKRVQLRYPNRLRKYVALKSITDPMAQAGETLASDWEAAGLIPRQTANLNGTGGGYKDITTHQIDARKRLNKALAGDRKKYADLLVSVCCFDRGVQNTRRLRRALLTLAYHYGLIRRGLSAETR